MPDSTHAPHQRKQSPPAGVSHRESKSEEKGPFQFKLRHLFILMTLLAMLMPGLHAVLLLVHWLLPSLPDGLVKLLEFAAAVGLVFVVLYWPLLVYLSFQLLPRGPAILAAGSVMALYSWGVILAVMHADELLVLLFFNCVWLPLLIPLAKLWRDHRSRSAMIERQTGLEAHSFNDRKGRQM